MREPSKGLTRELQVGLFIFAACLVIAAFSFRITDNPIFRRGTTLIAYFDDATGIFKNSKVKMAGIDIGVIKSIQLEGGKAKIRMLINSGVDIPKNAIIVPRPLGILGDKFLEIVVPPEDGSPHPPGLPLERDTESEKGGQSFFSLFPAAYAETPKGNYHEGEVMKSQNAPATLDDLTRQMGSVGQDLKAISSTLRKLIEGNEQDLQSPLGRSIKNSEKLTANLNGMVQENRGELKSTISSLNRLTQKLERAFDKFDENKMRADLSRLADAAGNMSRSLENVEKITSKVERGEGTLGKLVNDPTTVAELNRALHSVNTLVDRAQRTQVVVDISSEYDTVPKQAKTYVGAGVYPREDTAYLGAVVIDPMGTRVKVVTDVSVGGGPVTRTETITNDRSALRFSLQYFKRIWSMGFRLGLFENTGGLGFDLFAFNNQVRLSTELYKFSREESNPNLKVSLQTQFFHYFYLSLGGDELLAKRGDPLASRSFFAGLGLRFSDDDLKTLTLLPSVR